VPAAVLLAGPIAFRRPVPYVVGLGIALTSLLPLAALIGWLYSRFSRLPLLRQKGSLSSEEARLLSGLRGEAGKAESARRGRDRITQEGEKALSDRQMRRDGIPRTLARRRADIEAAETREQGAAMARLQHQHVAQGLMMTAVREGRIPGVGDKFKDRLTAGGVKVSADVTEARLRAIPGFGDAKVPAVLE
jgi:hypothetical protein